jgi:hypothetical protein
MECKHQSAFSVERFHRRGKHPQRGYARRVLVSLGLGRLGKLSEKVRHSE